jgi:uncharacterized protein DUF4071
MRDEAAFEDTLLRQAIETYATGFVQDPRHYYPGINAVVLLHLLKHLTGEDQDAERREAMEGGVRWAVLRRLRQHPDDYWARITLADLLVLSGDKPAVERAYKHAVAVADQDWFNLDSPRQQLELLRELGFGLMPSV